MWCKLQTCGIRVAIFDSNEAVIVRYSSNVASTLSIFEVCDGWVDCKLSKSDPKSRTRLSTAWFELIIGFRVCAVSKGSVFDEETNFKIIVS